MMPPQHLKEQKMKRKKELTLEQLEALIAEEEKEMRKELEEDDKKALKDGYTHRVDAWIHPSSGDDRQISMYTIGKLTDVEVQALLKKKRSTILTDYKIIAL